MPEHPDSSELPGLWLRRQREAAALTQEELAERSGLSTRTIRNLECDRTAKPHPRSLRLMAGALGLSEAVAGEVIARYRVGWGASPGLSHQPGGRVTTGSPLGPDAGGWGRAGRALIVVVPRQLPAAVGYFAGRAAELAVLDRWREQARSNGTGAVVISAIGGMAGVGKTALAVHWAHQVAGHFPDGQLYANLRGYDPSGMPVSPADAIRGFLDALDVRPEQIPGDLDGQARLYRSLLAGKKMLIMLDNARDEAQVRPLLPATPDCLVVVTSRSQLTGLVAAEGAHPLMLGALAAADAHELLARRLGEERVSGEPQAATDLVTLCGGLPLALAIASARAALRPDFPLASVARELRNEQRRLDSLNAHDAATSVRTAFSWSYQRLAAPAAEMFRLLGLHPAPDITVPAAACLDAVLPDQAADLLDELTRACLLTEHQPGRYAFHDLLRAYAAEQARAHETAEERHAALNRLFEYYLSSASAAIEVFLPAQGYRYYPVTAGPVPQQLATPLSPHSWFDAERANLVAVVAHADTCGWPDHATRLAAILFSYLDKYGHYSDALAVHTHALHAARHSDDRAAHAHALVDLAGVKWRQGLCRQAAIRLGQALTMFCDIGDLGGQARALVNLGVVLFRQGQYPQAAVHHQQALTIFRDCADRYGQANALDCLGTVLSRQGLHRQAAEYHRQAGALFREIGNHVLEAHALDNLGAALCQQGLYEHADDCFQEALTVFRETSCRHGEADTLVNIGVLLCKRGIYEQALDVHHQALAIVHDMGDRAAETRALVGMGASQQALGRHEEARTQYLDALSLADQIGDPYLQAAAHDGIAFSLHATGFSSKARCHWEDALTIYTRYGVPGADHVRQRLGNQ